MAQTPLCVSEPDNIVPFHFDLIVITLFILILLSLLTHSLYIEWSKRKDPNFQILSRQSRIGYIALQFLALYWTISDLIRHILDPLGSFLPDTRGCVILTYSNFMITGLFYTIYLDLILLRLENLDGTYLKPSQCTMLILRGFICSVMGIQIAFLCVDGDPVCLQSLQPPDMDRDMWYCQLIITSHRRSLLLGGITMIVFLNLTMGALFARRLQQVVRRMEENQHVTIQLRKIVIQNTILITTGSISTLVFYSVWIVCPPTGLWLYLDLLINCCVIGLAFPHNNRWYILLCGHCIKCCWKKFDTPGVESIPLPARNAMPSIGEHAVLELATGLVPQNKYEFHPSDSNKSETDVGDMDDPSGSMSASDPGQSEYESRASSLLPSLTGISMTLTEKSLDESKRVSENWMEASVRNQIRSRLKHANM